MFLVTNDSSLHDVLTLLKYTVVQESIDIPQLLFLLGFLVK